MIVLTARNGAVGPWTSEDVLSLLDVREPRDGMSVEERRRVDRFRVSPGDRTYFAGTPRTKQLLRAVMVGPKDLSDYFGAADQFVGGRAFMETEQLPDGWLLLCERNPDERSRRDVGLAMMVGMERPLGADIVTPKMVYNCARCGQNHAGLVFTPLDNAADEWRYWTMCPVTRQPILMATLSDAKPDERLWDDPLYAPDLRVAEMLEQNQEPKDATISLRALAAETIKRLVAAAAAKRVKSIDDAEPVSAAWLGIGERESLTLAPAPPLINQNSVYVHWQGPKNSMTSENIGWSACVNSAAFAHSVKLDNRGHLRDLVHALRITEPADVLARLGVYDA